MIASTMTSPDVAFAAAELGQRLLACSARTDVAPAFRTIAVELLRHPMAGAAGGADALARRAGVSPASVSRFARSLGYTGHAQLRGAIAQALERLLQPGHEPIDRPVEKLRARTGSAARARAAVAESQQATAGNVASAMANLGATDLGRLAADLSRARRVYVMGFGLSAHLAGLLALSLEPFLPQVVDVVAWGGSELAAGRLLDIGPSDVLVALSLPRYSADALRLAEMARARRAPVLAITDSPASPLARLATEVLFAPARHPVLPGSVAAAVAVIEALATAVMVASPAHVGRARRLTSATAAYLAAAPGDGKPG
jgi:DNA-binding MurR/RpiR family transcriptional regulator